MGLHVGNRGQQAGDLVKGSDGVGRGGEGGGGEAGSQASQLGEAISAWPLLKTGDFRAASTVVQAAQVVCCCF